MCWSHRLQRERATVGSAGRPDYQGGLRTLLHVGQAGAAPDSPGTEPRSPLPSPCRPQAERSAAPQLVQQPGGPGPSPPTSSCLSPQLPREGTGQGSMWEQGFPSELLQAAAGGAQWPHWSRAHPGPDVATAPKAWVHNPGFSGLPCERPWVPAWNQTAWAGQLGRPGCWLCPALTLRGCWVGQAPSASAWELLSAKAACHAASKGR